MMMMMMIVSSSSSVAMLMLCGITVSLILLTISADASIHDHPQLQVFHELLGAASDDYQPLHLHPGAVLPRKLMVLNKKDEDYEAAYNKGRLVSSNQQNKPAAYSGRREEVKLVRVHAKGTREEWIHEGSDESHELFFTMDYSHVRRRRPIHNKSLIP